MARKNQVILYQIQGALLCRLPSHKQNRLPYTCVFSRTSLSNILFRVYTALAYGNDGSGSVSAQQVHATTTAVWRVVAGFLLVRLIGPRLFLFPPLIASSLV